LGEWLKAQASWMYLEPIFGSPDILEQMPREGSLFHATNKVFRQIMDDAAKFTCMMDVCLRKSLKIILIIKGNYAELASNFGR